MKRTAILLSVLLCFSCSVKKVSYDVLLTKNDRISDLDSIQLINNKDDYNKIYNELNKTIRPGLPVEPVDFSKNSVLVIPYKVKQENYNDIKIELSSKSKLLNLDIKEYLNDSKDSGKYYRSPLYILKLDGVYKDLKVKVKN